MGQRNRFVGLLILVVLIPLLSGCYLNKMVEADEVGIQMDDGASISRIVGQGRYTVWKWFAKMKIIKISALTLQWDDPDLVTRDKQPIGVAIGITFARMGDAESIKYMYTQYNAIAINDDQLTLQVLNRIPRIAKEITAKYTLDDMLGVGGDAEQTRSSVTKDLFNLLEPELREARIQLLDVGINNISPSADYLNLLQQKANAAIETEVNIERKKQLDVQLQQEVAQTNIDMEKARRQNLVNAELAKTYELSPQFYELERIKQLKGLLGGTDKIYFVPAGTDLSLVLTGGAINEQSLISP